MKIKVFQLSDVVYSLKRDLTDEEINSLKNGSLDLSDLKNDIIDWCDGDCSGHANIGFRITNDESDKIIYSKDY